MIGYIKHRIDIFKCQFKHVKKYWRSETINFKNLSYFNEIFIKQFYGYVQYTFQRNEHTI